MSALAGRVVVVAGAPHGAGAAIVRAVAAAHAMPLLAFWRGGDQAQALVRELEAAARRLELVRASPAEPGSESVILRAALDRLGGLDALVLDVTATPEPVPGWRGYEEAAARCLIGPVLLARAALPAMRRGGAGAVVGVAPQDGPEPITLAGDGLLAWCRRAAAELGREGIGVAGVEHAAGADEMTARAVVEALAAAMPE